MSYQALIMCEGFRQPCDPGAAGISTSCLQNIPRLAQAVSLESTPPACRQSWQMHGFRAACHSMQAMQAAKGHLCSLLAFAMWPRVVDVQPHEPHSPPCFVMATGSNVRLNVHETRPHGDCQQTAEFGPYMGLAWPHFFDSVSQRGP